MIDATLAIVVVNYGSSALLQNQLTAVARDLEGAQCVVVDSFSDEAERRRVRLMCDANEWIGVYPPRNVGFGGGCNIGVRAAQSVRATRFLLLNPDAAIDRSSVELMLERLDADPMTLAGPTIVRPDGSLWSAGVDVDLRTGDMRSWRHRTGPPDAEILPWLTGACLLVDQSLWEAVEGFDEEYFLYWEDVDLSARVQAIGGTLSLVPGATAIHDEGGTHQDQRSDRAKSSVYYYYNIRNRFLFARKNLDPIRQRQWRRNSLRASYRILLRGGRRQLVHSSSPWRAAMRGMRDGIRA